MAKNPEKITIKISRDQLNDQDEITIELPKEESRLDKSLGVIEGIHQKAREGKWYRKTLYLLLILLLIYVILLVIIFGTGITERPPETYTPSASELADQAALEAQREAGIVE